MAIIGLQRRIREVGRIRIGVQTDTRSGKRAPKKLDRFRFTSPDRSVIEAAATIYGGSAQAWDNNGTPQWECISDATELRIALPPDPNDMAWSQFYETWGAGFAQKRCDGVRDTIRDRACDCDPEARTCKPTSRLSVLLPDIAGLGLWRLESHGYYAAVELAGAIDLIQQMAGAHSVIPARLRLELREVRRLVNNKPTVRKFAVPCIDLDVSIMGVRSIAVQVGGDPVLEAPETPALEAGWAPVPDPEPPEVLSVVEQVKEQTKPRAKPERANAAAPIPPTGRAPGRTKFCHLCGAAYGTEPLVRNPDPSEGGTFVHKACVDGGTESEASPVGGEPPEPVLVVDGGDGQPGVSTDASTEPVPAVARPAPSIPTAGPDHMTHGQHKKIMAMTAELFPVDPQKVTGPQANEYRRNVTLGICEALGTVGLTSRGDIDRATAIVLIDALEGIERGELRWDDDAGQLVDVETSAVIGFRRDT